MLTPGTRLGPYEVLSPLGAGGMGEVFRARDTRLNREVALKFLPSRFAEDPERHARFEREAKVLASLNHPNIAVLYGLEHVDGQHALVMELVEGEGLDTRVARGALPVEEALPIALQIAEALEAAHDKGIVHRDLKPANVKVRPDGTVKVLDFGLAKAWDEPAGDSDPAHSPTITGAYTRPDVVLGTLSYMSPEQARGKQVDRRTDVWAFGCVLYEMLSGVPAFRGDTATDVLAAIVTREPAWEKMPAGLWLPLESVLRRCLEKDPKRRMRDIGDVRLEIEECVQSPRPAGAVAPGSTLRFPRPVIAWVPWVLVAALIVAALWGWRHAGRPGASRGFGTVRLAVPLPEGVSLSYEEDNQQQVVAAAPDGSRLAFVGAQGGASRLFVRPLGAADAVPLAGTANARDPVFSPDSEYIAFVADGKLRRISLAGGLPETICASGDSRGVAWGSDGTIVFAPTVNSGLMRVSAQGGEPKPLTALSSDGNERSHRWPQILPDGTTVLFTVGSQGKAGDYEDSAIDAVSLSSGKRWHVFSGASMARYLSSGHLALARLGALSIVPFDLASGQVHGAPVPVLEGVGGEPRSGVSYFDLTAAGSLVFISGVAGERPRQLVRLRGGMIEPLGLPAGLYRSVSVSPGGDRIAYTEGPGGGGRLDLWIYDVAEKDSYRLTSDGQGGAPVWTPDGRNILYTPPASTSVLHRAADGSGPARAVWQTSGPGLYGASSVTPDGATLLMVRYGLPTRGDILELPLHGDPIVHPLLETPASEDEPQISPDGRWIAYHCEEPPAGYPQVYVQAYPNPGARWSITQGAGQMGGASPRWSRDGRELYFVQNDLSLWAVPVRLRPEFVAGRPEKIAAVADVVPRNYTDSRYDVLTGERDFVLIVAEKPTGPPPKLEIILGWADALRGKGGAGDSPR